MNPNDSPGERPSHRSSTTDDFRAARELAEPAPTPEASLQPSSERGARPLKYLGLAGVAGLVLLVGGCAVNIRAYDERFIYHNDPHGVWEFASLIGGLAAVGGVLLILTAIVGAAVVGVVRLVRAAKRGAQH